jgi:pyridoxine 5-phosphate synthase
MPGLCIKLDHVATLREVRGTRYPDPSAAAIEADLAGADAIVVHLRETRRHIQEEDLFSLRRVVQSAFLVEISLASENMGLALKVKPDTVILVPEQLKEPTTRAGLDLMIHKEAAAEAVSSLISNGISACVLIDPDPEQVKLAHQIDARLIEIHAGRFAWSKQVQKRNEAFSNILDAVKLAHKLQLGIRISHGLNYINIKAFKGIHEIDDYAIGHSIVSRAVMVGMQTAVRDMLDLIHQL